jgi:hypothetical protein
MVESQPTRDFRPLFTWRSGIMSSELPAMTKYVALALSLHMNEMGGSCFPSAARLASECSINSSTIWAGLKKLQEDGWLVVTEHGGVKGKSRRANVYEARVPIAQDHRSDQDNLHTYRPDRAAPIAHANTSTSLSTSELTGVGQDNRSRFVERCETCQRLTLDCECGTAQVDKAAAKTAARAVIENLPWKREPVAKETETDATEEASE